MKGDARHPVARAAQERISSFVEIRWWFLEDLSKISTAWKSLDRSLHDGECRENVPMFHGSIKKPCADGENLLGETLQLRVVTAPCAAKRLLKPHF